MREKVEELRDKLNSKIDPEFNFEFEHYGNGNFDDSYEYGVEVGEEYTYREIVGELDEILIEKTYPKLLILGSARHGKDTLAEIWRDEFGLTFKSSSQAASDIFLYETLREKYGYKTSEECFEDRVNHRPEWKQLICDYNKDDRAKLAKGILANSDCYVGMRDKAEIDECMRQGLFDLIIWVDASERLPLESPDSFDIDKSCAHIIIENNGTFAEFKEKVLLFGKILLKF